MSLIDAAKRAEYLLSTVKKYLERHPVQGYTLRYDGAVCDGHCLADDCASAADELRIELKKAEVSA